MKTNYTAIDLFQGVGGASLGLIKAGFKVVAALDNDQEACDTYKKNFELKPICDDLKNVSGTKILETFGIRKGDTDLLVGCPPCQGFSSLRRTRYPTMEDNRKELVTIFPERVKEIAPKAVIFENVPGVADVGGLPYFSEYLRVLGRLGFSTSWNFFDAVNYGVPQHRKRVIALSILGRESLLPLPTHANPRTKTNLKPWKTVRDTIANLPKLQAGQTDLSTPNHEARNHSDKILKLISLIPKDGGSWRDLPPELWLPCHVRLKDNKGAGNIYGRLWWDKPSGTMTCRCTSPSCGRFLHPEQNRAITPREAACLQSFPMDYEFPEQKGSAEKQIGNAVPPDLLTVFAKTIKEYL